MHSGKIEDRGSGQSQDAVANASPTGAKHHHTDGDNRLSSMNLSSRIHAPNYSYDAVHHGIGLFGLIDDILVPTCCV